MGVHARQMERLEQTAGLDRALEALPTAKVLQERHASGRGLTSPELAVLLAYTKLELQRALVASDVPDDPYLDADFVAYFPPSLRTGFDDALASHPLRREIVATVVANAVVNRAGISFLSRLCDETGLSLPVLARAHVIARDVFDAADTWSAVDALDLVVPAAVQDEMFLLVRRLVERSARWLVRHAEPLALGPTVERFRAGVHAVTQSLPELRWGRSATRWPPRPPASPTPGWHPTSRAGSRRATQHWSRSRPSPSRSSTTSTPARSHASSSCSTTASDSTASATASPRSRAPTAGRPRRARRSATTSTSRSTR